MVVLDRNDVDFKVSTQPSTSTWLLSHMSGWIICIIISTQNFLFLFHYTFYVMEPWRAICLLLPLTALSGNNEYNWGKVYRANRQWMYLEHLLWILTIFTPQALRTCSVLILPWQYLYQIQGWCVSGTKTTSCHLSHYSVHGLFTTILQTGSTLRWWFLCPKLGTRSWKQ